VSEHDAHDEGKVLAMAGQGFVVEKNNSSENLLKIYLPPKPVKGS
jgi:hypothetical protein